ncbi:MAG: ligand-binding protein SH3 [Hadesarchaea archaeon]|nr:MAG: ligand-binding protein SH3 [Hadesarchaea archaeon]
MVIEWLVFLISVAPFIELRGAIPLAIAAGYDPVSVFIICVVLNLLVIPIAFVMLDFILPPIRRRVKFVDHIFGWFVKRARKHQRLSLVGLAAFVGIPLPVTGAYTGALIAYTAGIDRKRAALAIAAGVVIAGIIIWVLATLGIIWIRSVSP